MYTIRYLARLDLLDITWSGLFTPDEMEGYANECRAVWKREQFRDGYRLRIVLSDNKPLPQSTLTVLETIFDDFPRAGRIAMVTSGSIAKMQIRRTMMVPHMEIFDTPEEALQWLNRPADPES